MAGNDAAGSDPAPVPRLSGRGVARIALMAFLVCYSLAVEDHAKDPRRQAAYLSQAFYELIFDVCRPDRRAFPVLGRIANLRYKSPTLLLDGPALIQLVRELRSLAHGGDGARDLLAASEQAMARQCSLTISGDMYPELDGPGR